jgi:hypothetical protein
VRGPIAVLSKSCSLLLLCYLNNWEYAWGTIESNLSNWLKAIPGSDKLVFKVVLPVDILYEGLSTFHRRSLVPYLSWLKSHLEITLINRFLWNKKDLLQRYIHCIYIYMRMRIYICEWCCSVSMVWVQIP